MNSRGDDFGDDQPIPHGDPVAMLPAPTGSPVAATTWVPPRQPISGGVDPGAAISMRGLGKRFGDKIAVRGIDLDIEAGSFFGLVGPNGAGKTTTLSMCTGLLRPDAGAVSVLGHDVWSDPVGAKRLIGVLPDGLRIFDRLTGLQLIVYAGLLRGLDRPTATSRGLELLDALGLTDDAGTLVVDYSAGMTKKVTLACALVHAPRLVVLDEPFEAVDPVSATTIRKILEGFVGSGGTVVLSSHVMDLVQRLCSHVAVIADGRVIADGTVEQVRGGESLEERFVDLVGGRTDVEGLEWLRSSSH